MKVPVNKKTQARVAILWQKNIVITWKFLAAWGSPGFLSGWTFLAWDRIKPDKVPKHCTLQPERFHDDLLITEKIYRKEKDILLGSKPF